MYKPDRYFMRRIKELDPRLGCEFNRNTERFTITYQRATGKPVPIMRVEAEGGGFRQPDQRELNVLGESDCERVSMRDRLNRASKYMQDYREKKQRDASQNIRDWTKDGKIQLKNAVGRLAGGKGNSAFRRIEPKPKGQAF